MTNFARNIRNPLLLVLLCLAACSSESPDSGHQSAQGTKLMQSLDRLNLQNPAADVDAALSRGSTHFVGINGFSCVAPGVDAASLPPGIELKVDCIDGTSDIHVRQEEGLRQKADNYARAYNAELLRRLAR